jgi:hypothetical protein
MKEMAFDLAKADLSVAEDTLRKLEEAATRLSALLHILGVGRDRFAAALTKAKDAGSA